MMYKFSALALILSGVAIFTLFYILFWPVQVIKPNTIPYKVLTPIVKVGGDLVYQVDACKFIDSKATVYRSFVDGQRYPALISFNNIRKGCGITNVKIPVPNFVIPGKYHLELDIEYRINALKSVTYHFRTEEFYIIENDRQNKIDELIE